MDGGVGVLAGACVCACYGVRVVDVIGPRISIPLHMLVSPILLCQILWSWTLPFRVELPRANSVLVERLGTMFDAPPDELVDVAVLHVNRRCLDVRTERDRKRLKERERERSRERERERYR